MDTKLVEDKDKTGTGEVLRLGQQTKSRLKQHQTSHMVLLAAEHWLVGSDKYRLQHSQMNVNIKLSLPTSQCSAARRTM